MTLKSASVARGVRLPSAPVVASLAGLAAGSAGPVAAESWPANVRAVYDINFNGFNVGTFEFQSQAEQQSYTLIGNAQPLDAARRLHLGRARPAASALIVNQAPKPACLLLRFQEQPASRLDQDRLRRTAPSPTSRTCR